MAKKKSMLATAGEMTLSVGKTLDETHERLEEYLKHLESRKAHLESLLDGSHQPDVEQMIAEVDLCIDAVKKAMERVDEGAKRAYKIEERL